MDSMGGLRDPSRATGIPTMELQGFAERDVVNGTETSDGVAAHRVVGYSPKAAFETGS